MRRILLLAVAVATISPAAVFAAEATQTREAATTAPKKWDFHAHYRKRVAAIHEAIAALPSGTTKTVVLLGDSITEGNPAKTLAGMPAVNMGISGDHIASPLKDAGVAARVGLLADAKPAHVFLLIGINDFGSSKPVEKARAEYAALVASIRETVPGAQLHLQSILPTSGRYAFHNPTVLEMNRHIGRIAGEQGCDYVDLHPMMADGDGRLRADWTRDGLHLLPPAYAEWAKVLEGRIALWNSGEDGK